MNQVTLMFKLPIQLQEFLSGAALVVVATIVATVAATPTVLAADNKALVGGRLIDGVGNRPVANSVILISDNIITEVGTTDTLPIPAGYEIISTEGMDVLPGLWDSHVHLILGGHSNYRHWMTAYGDRFVDEIIPASAQQFLAAGITTVRDMGAPVQEILTVRDRINRGEVVGSRILAAGPFIQHKPYADTAAGRWGINGESDAKKKINKLADAGVDFIKMIDQDKMTLKEVETIVNTAHTRGLNVIAHARRPEEIRRGLTYGVDNFEHVGLASAPGYPDTLLEKIQERTAKGFLWGPPLFWTPTVSVRFNYPHQVDNPEFIDGACWHRGLQPDTIADIKASLQEPGHMRYNELTPLRVPTLKHKVAQLKEAGVVFLVGTDSGIPMNFHCTTTADEMDVLVNDMDIPAMDVIRGASYWPSTLMGVNKQWGTIQPGLYADIIAVRGDVLRDIELLKRIDMVMKDGVVYKENGQVIEARFK
jgi:imidazolonepropionase-like amidohydrolase